MKNFFLYIQLLISLASFGQTDSILHGIKTSKNFQVVRLKKSTGVIISPTYARDSIFTGMSKDSIVFFKPDVNTIKLIDENLSKIYVQTIQRFNTQWDSLNKQNKEDELETELEARKIVSYDKQFFGYINPAGEKIIKILLFNFEHNPFHLKSRLNKEYIFGYHGWFETNTRRLTYNLKSKKFTVNDDL